MTYLKRILKPKVTDLLERDIEKYFIRQVELAGGETRKLSWINRSNAPDRLVMLNGPHFVELKAPGQKPRMGQVREFFRMKQLGCLVSVLDTKEGVDRWIRKVTQ